VPEILQAELVAAEAACGLRLEGESRAACGSAGGNPDRRVPGEVPCLRAVAHDRLHLEARHGRLPDALAFTTGGEVGAPVAAGGSIVGREVAQLQHAAERADPIFAREGSLGRKLPCVGDAPGVFGEELQRRARALVRLQLDEVLPGLVQVVGGHLQVRRDAGCRAGEKRKRRDDASHL
jgi:hypothetical protein